MQFPSFQPGFREIDGTDLANLAALLSSSASGLVATGATRATALQLTTAVNEVATTAAGTGVVLAPSQAGFRQTVVNDGANSLTVYANGSDQLVDHSGAGVLVAGSVGVALASGYAAVFVCYAPGKFKMITGA